MNIFNKSVYKCRRILEALISKNVDLNLLNYNQWSPLHIAVRNGQYDAVKASLKHNLKCKALKDKHVFDLNI